MSDPQHGAEVSRRELQAGTEYVVKSGSTWYKATNAQDYSFKNATRWDGESYVGPAGNRDFPTGTFYELPPPSTAASNPAAIAEEGGKRRRRKATRKGSRKSRRTTRRKRFT